MVRSALWRVLALLLLPACVTADLPPISIIPPDTGVLSLPVAEGTLAVLDFADLRPPEESTDLPLSDTFLTRFHTPGYYWSFQGEDVSNLEPVTNSAGDIVFRRVTGDRAFLWFPFPYTGIGPAGTRETALGLADYFANALQRRGLVDRVIRVKSPEEAARHQARWLLVGEVLHFVCFFDEIPAREWFEVEHPDDIRLHRFSPIVALELQLQSTQDGSNLWSKSLAAPEIEQDHPYDQLYPYLGTKFRDTARLDPADLPGQAFQDMQSHLVRNLHGLTALCLEDIEATLGQSASPIH